MKVWPLLVSSSKMVVNTFVERDCRIIIIFHTKAWLAAYNAMPANGLYTEERRPQFAVDGCQTVAKVPLIRLSAFACNVMLVNSLLLFLPHFNFPLKLEMAANWARTPA